MNGLKQLGWKLPYVKAILLFFVRKDFEILPLFVL